MKNTNSDTENITRDDLANEFRRVLGEKSPKSWGKSGMGILASLGVFLALCLLVYLFGRRRGKRGRAILEIKRI